MSRLRFEQIKDVSHISHVHDGLNGEKINYFDILNRPVINNCKHYVANIQGTNGVVYKTTHRCGSTPLIQCVYGTEVVDIDIVIVDGDIYWDSNINITSASNCYLSIYGSEVYRDIDNIDDYAEYWCGYEWNVNDSNPAVTRITGNGLQNYFLRDGGGILKGTLFEYVAVDSATGEEVIVPIDDPTEYENYRYGQHGDLFAKMKGQLYYKVERDGDIRRKKLSRYPLAGFKPYHSNDYIVYIGLYEASCNNERTKIYSRVTPQSEYATHLGGDIVTAHAGAGSWTSNKFYNTPATSLSTTKFSDLAHSKGDGYDIMDYMTWLMLSDLFMAEFGTRNGQLPIQGADSNGYSRGGLGNGVSNVSNWGVYNNYNPVAEMGCTDNHGSRCGQSLVPACSSLGLMPANAVYANRFYGIENPFGHIFKLLTGIHFITKGNATDTFESYKTFICDDPSKFMVADNRDNGTDDVTVQFEAGYDYEGEKAHSNGYIKDVIFGDYGSMIPSAVGGGSSTYFSDYNYSNIGTGGFFSGLRWAPFGGASNNGSIDGWFFVYSNTGWSISHQAYGARLCLYKQPYEEIPFFVEDCSGEDNTIIIKKSNEESPDVSVDTVNWKVLRTPTTEGSEIYLPANKRVYMRGNNKSWGKFTTEASHTWNFINAIRNFNVGGI